MTWVRWIWKVAACASIFLTADNTSVFITRSRQVSERAINPPVLRVRRPAKSSRPVFVAATYGCNSSAALSMTDGGTRQSTIAPPSSLITAAISSADAVATTCLMLIDVPPDFASVSRNTYRPLRRAQRKPLFRMGALDHDQAAV